MIIINQDQDESYNLSTKDIHYRPHFIFHKFRSMFMGWNLYGRTKEQLLGTFNSRQACKVVIAEIKQHERAGRQIYIIPEESDGLEE